MDRIKKINKQFEDLLLTSIDVFTFNCSSQIYKDLILLPITNINHKYTKNILSTLIVYDKKTKFIVGKIIKNPLVNHGTYFKPLTNIFMFKSNINNIKCDIQCLSNLKYKVLQCNNGCLSDKFYKSEYNFPGIVLFYNNIPKFNKFADIVIVCE